MKSDIPSAPGASGFNALAPEILKKIDALVDLVKLPGPGPDNRDLVREIIVTALKTQHSQLDRGDVKVLNRALRELRYGFRIFKDYRERRKVTIFGSARTPATDPDYIQARTFSQKMAAHGFMIITGAGPGIMQAGNEGAGKGNGFGINIRLPYEQAANEFIANDTLFIDCRFFFTRKLMFVKETSAVAFFPGGFGTHDEGMEIMTLVQTGKSDPMPIVFVDSPGGDYWKDWQAYLVKQLLGRKKISAEDLDLYKITDSVDAAVEEIVRFYSNYHSMRFVKDDLVIRVQKGISPKRLESLNADFHDICLQGSIAPTDALPEEDDHRDLPRLRFRFNRLSYGRLRQLINRLNQA